jgi:Ca2+-binding EF-hand superfamily protein
MNSLATKLIPVAIASILCGVAVAGGGKDKLSKMDKDGDGTVTAAEYAEGSKAMFGKLDKDGDGYVTAAEMDAAHGPMDARAHSNEQAAARTEGGSEQTMADKKAYNPSGSGKAMTKQMSSTQKIAAMDTNNDGKLSEAEHAAGAKKRFSKMDTDGDGSLTAQELRKAESWSLTASDIE